MESIQNIYLDLKGKLLLKQYAFLNTEQRQAVLTTNGPLLILAGAGSGKTTVLTQRIAHLVKYGTTYEDQAIPYNLCEEHITVLKQALAKKEDDPNYEYSEAINELIACGRNIFSSNILAITFTNKAAKEMKERIEKIVGEEAQYMWVSTFHSACARILRYDIESIGYGKNFTIYDTADQVAVVKMILKEKNLDLKLFSPKSIVGRISSLKNKNISPKSFKKQSVDDYKNEILADIFEKYQEMLKKNNALDFDDLINKTIELLEINEEIRQKYAKKFKYILVDEYQDTNQSQYKLVRLLSDTHENICVVGDDDQSIYAWRGADIKNILGFEQDYKEAKTIRLERNYRSTQTILDAANNVIANNKGRKGKNLWTNKASQSKIIVSKVRSDREESDYVAKRIHRLIQTQAIPLNNIAILYRTNSQSRAIEEGLLKYSIKYKIFGGIRFYDRKEVKDIMAYLSLINNPANNVSLLRIINVPKRGIGAATLDKLVQLAEIERLSIFELLIEQNEKIPPRIYKKIEPFVELITELIAKSYVLSITDFIQAVLDDSGYLDMLMQENTIENQSRIENIKQLVNAAGEFEEMNPNSGLTEFLENVALVSGDDEQSIEEQDFISLMTIHSAKGLEFDTVFIMGFEERLFPHMMSMDSDSGIEEERRLCYVAITRAKKQLYITHSGYRFINGSSVDCSPSRFLKEIPIELIEEEYQAVSAGGYVSKQATRAPITSFRRDPIGGVRPKPKEKKNEKLCAGDFVLHKTFGKGKVINIDGDQIIISFERGGNRRFSLSFAPIKKL